MPGTWQAAQCTRHLSRLLLHQEGFGLQARPMGRGPLRWQRWTMLKEIEK